MFSFFQRLLTSTTRDEPPREHEGDNMKTRHKTTEESVGTFRPIDVERRDSEREDGEHGRADTSFLRVDTGRSASSGEHGRRASSPLFIKKTLVKPPMQNTHTHHCFPDVALFPPPDIKKRTFDIEIDGTKTHLSTHTPLQQIVQQAEPTSTNIKTPGSEKAHDPIPEPEFAIRNDVEFRIHTGKSDGLVRFVAKSQDEQDEEVEYDMDEEDLVWTELIKKEMGKGGKEVMTSDAVELLIDRLEKESFFLTQAKGPVRQPEGEEEAVCCICNDGDTEQGNSILFCDSCNIPVHQECYGVPYIPEGLWLCRRCQFAPAGLVSCVLCPNKAGAFKQTESGRWAHAVCAFWVPEVSFANESILEPVVGVERVPKARWKLTCYICSKKGACIQCSVKHCCVAYHPTCALKANLYMKMMADDEKGNPRNVSYCDAHTPSGWGPVRLASVQEAEVVKAPVIAIPVVPMDRLKKIATDAGLSIPEPVLKRLHTYWLLKRQSRSGVPLIRRLQGSQARPTVKEADADAAKLKSKVQRLRMCLERLRLLAELVVKRERAKRDMVRVRQQIFAKQVHPLPSILRHTLSQLRKADTSQLFHEPVDAQEVPDYYDVIKEPMDLQTLGQKLERNEYRSIDSFQADVFLIPTNAMRYNRSDTIYYQQAYNFNRKAKAIIQQARERIKGLNIDAQSGLLVPFSEAQPPPEVHVTDALNGFSSSSAETSNRHPEHLPSEAKPSPQRSSTAIPRVVSSPRPGPAVSPRTRRHPPAVPPSPQKPGQEITPTEPEISKSPARASRRLESRENADQREHLTAPNDSLPIPTALPRARRGANAQPSEISLSPRKLRTPLILRMKEMVKPNAEENIKTENTSGGRTEGGSERKFPRRRSEMKEEEDETKEETGDGGRKKTRGNGDNEGVTEKRRRPAPVVIRVEVHKDQEEDTMETRKGKKRSRKGEDGEEGGDGSGEKRTRKKDKEGSSEKKSRGQGDADMERESPQTRRSVRGSKNTERGSEKSPNSKASRGGKERGKEGRATTETLGEREGRSPRKPQRSPKGDGGKGEKESRSVETKEDVISPSRTRSGKKELWSSEKTEGYEKKETRKGGNRAPAKEEPGMEERRQTRSKDIKEGEQERGTGKKRGWVETVTPVQSPTKKRKREEDDGTEGEPNSGVKLSRKKYGTTQPVVHVPPSDVPFEFGDAVWANPSKTAWYPAQIVNPAHLLARAGDAALAESILNGPGSELEESALLCYFDKRRTWQWLKKSKLAHLGKNKELDRSMLNINRARATMQEAYDSALSLRSKGPRAKTR